MAQAPVTALATAVGLQLPESILLRAGDFLRLSINPDASATARTVTGTELTAARAFAVGLGTGLSPYYSLLEEAQRLNSRKVSIQSGAGYIDGNANAEAFASGRGDTSAEATALNTGLAGINWLNNYAGNLYVGTTGTPFAATARVAAGSQLAPALGAAAPSSSLDATARVRGVESSQLLGQPNATVAATTTLDLATSTASTKAVGLADSVGLDGVQATAVTNGSGVGATTTISGDATSRVVVRAGETLPPGSTLGVAAPAFGISNSEITTAPSLNTTVRGAALATIATEMVDGDGNPLNKSNQTLPVTYDNLQGIGIQSSLITAGRGNTTVVGVGGVADGGARFNGYSTPLAAGINESKIITNLGNDSIFGKVLNEVEAGVDADNDGLLESGVYLTHDADNGGQGDSFNGIRNSTVLTGAGDDTISGSASGSFLYTMNGNNTIDLDRARESSLWGSFGNDTIGVKEQASNVVAWGSLGEDHLSGASDSTGNVFDGGLGVDFIEGSAGATDRFLFTDANAARLSSSGESFGRDLTNTQFWGGLSEEQKADLWSTGKLTGANGQLVGAVDTIANFEAGAGGDRLELNSSLASITQSLWEDHGTILQVDQQGHTSVVEGNANGTHGIAVIVGTLENIQKLGVGVGNIAYATDTHQLMYDPDGNWKGGSSSFGTVNTNGPLTKNNFTFGSTTAAAMGAPPTAPLP